jgi:hypothetical protein
MMGHRTNKTSIRFDDICLKREINWMKTATRQCVGGKMRSWTSGQNGVLSLQSSSEHQRWINRAELIPQKWYRWMKWINFFRNYKARQTLWVWHWAHWTSETGDHWGIVSWDGLPWHQPMSKQFWGNQCWSIPEIVWCCIILNLWSKNGL